MKREQVEAPLLVGEWGSPPDGRCSKTPGHSLAPHCSDLGISVSTYTKSSVAPDDLEFVAILLPRPSKCWDYRCITPS